MKITKKELENLIQEELQKQIDEGVFGNFIQKGVDKLKGAFGAKDWEKEVEKTAEPEMPDSTKGDASDLESSKTPDQNKSQQSQTKLDKAMTQAKTTSSDIVLPQANVLSRELTKMVGPSMQKVLGGLSQQQRGAVMTPIMNYLKSLPKMANPVIAEAETPLGVSAVDQGQMDLKARLASKHKANPALISKNLAPLKQNLLNQVKTKFTLDTVPNLLMYSLSKQQQDSKEGKAYLKSLMQNPKAHLDALLQNADLVISNVLALASSGLPEQSKSGQKPLPSEKAPEAKSDVESKPLDNPFMDVQRVGINESRRMKKLAGILKD